MATPVTSAVATSRTATVTCTFFNQGHKHLIKERPTIALTKEAAARIHATGQRYMLTITFQNGSTRRIIMGQFTEYADDRLAFTGMMANGSDLVRINVVFSGVNGGYVEVV